MKGKALSRRAQSPVEKATSRLASSTTTLIKVAL